MLHVENNISNEGNLRAVLVQLHECVSTVHVVNGAQSFPRAGVVLGYRYLLDYSCTHAEQCK